METLREVIKIREYLENQKKQCTFAVFKKTKVLTVPHGTLKKRLWTLKKLQMNFA
jgi:hypothetical protein